MGKIPFRRFLSLYGIYARMDLAWLLRDTKFALLAIFSDMCANLSSIAGVFLLAWRFDGLGGMSKYEVLLMLAYVNIITGIAQMYGGTNALHISRIIGRGQWEHMFIMPLPYGVQLTVGIFPFTSSSNLLSGITILCVAIHKLGLTLPWWWVLSLLFNVLLSLVIYICLSYLASTLAFYAPVQCEEISTYVLDWVGYIGRFPLSGMPRSLQLPLLTFLPAGLLAWFPTLALLGRPPLHLSAAFPLLLVIVLMFITAYCFKKGFNYYVQKGINRYLSGGHRR